MNRSSRSPSILEEYAKPLDTLFGKSNQHEEFRRYMEGLLLLGERHKTLTGLVTQFLDKACPRDVQRGGAPLQRQKVSVLKGIRVVERPCAYPTYPCQLA